MTERETLLAAVLSDPADDTARLVLADMLRESDNAEDRALGQFLWAGVTIAGFREDDLIEDRLYYTAQAEIAAVASAGFPARWLASVGLRPSPLTNRDWVWDNTRDRVSIRIGDVVGVFARGMLCELSITLGEWYAVASNAITPWPLERVTVTDVPGLTFTIEKATSGWRLSARLKVPARNAPLAITVVPSQVFAPPALIAGPGDWRVEEPFADRMALIAGIAPESASLVADLREVAGDRWPSPPRKRK